MLILETYMGRWKYLQGPMLVERASTWSRLVGKLCLKPTLPWPCILLFITLARVIPFSLLCLSFAFNVPLAMPLYFLLSYVHLLLPLGYYSFLFCCLLFHGLLLEFCLSFYLVLASLFLLPCFSCLFLIALPFTSLFLLSCLCHVFLFIFLLPRSHAFCLICSLLLCPVSALATALFVLDCQLYLFPCPPPRLGSYLSKTRSWLNINIP